MKKIASLVIALLLVVGMLSACATKDATVAEEPGVVEKAGDAEEKVVSNAKIAAEPAGENPTDEPISICVLQHDASNEYQKLMWNAFEAYLGPLQDRGVVTYFSLDGKGDIATQVSNVETAVAKGVDGILAITQDMNGLDDALNAAIAQGVEVVTYNTRVTSVEEYTFIGSEDYLAGVLQGEFMASEFPEEGGTFCYMVGYYGSECSETRRAGFMDAFTKLRPNAELLTELAGEWARDQGMAMTEDWLVKYPHIDAIASANDAMSLGAIEACKNAGRLYKDDSTGGEVKIYSLDGVEEAINAVINGELRCTVFQDAIGHSTEAARILIEKIRGSYTGGVDYLIDYELVTKENAENYLTRNLV